MDDGGDFAIAIVLGVVVLVVAAGALAVYFAPKPEPRHHMYYCMHPDSGTSMPCKFRRNDPVSVFRNDTRII